MIHNILVVDDEEIVLMTTKLMLKKLGKAVSAFSNSIEGLSYYQSHAEEIDLVIIDSHMPEKSGHELYADLCAANPNVIVVVSSAFADDEERKEYTDMGAQGVLTKPFSIADLKSVVESVE
jgi:CheY-like chemotaxis protein